MLTTPLLSFFSGQGHVLGTGGPGLGTVTKMRQTLLSSEVLKGRSMPLTHLSGYRQRVRGGVGTAIYFQAKLFQ